MKYFIIITGKVSIYLPDGTRSDTPGRRMVFNLVRYEGPMAVIEYGVYGECQVDTRDENVRTEAVE